MPTPRQARDVAALPFATMHAAMMQSRFEVYGGDPDTDDYNSMLVSYQLFAGRSDQLDNLADSCERRVTRYVAMPTELRTAYGALVALARWRSEQLRGGQG